ncbi:hypothetical protein ACLK1T_01100 [Escherichia coli]
MAYLQSGCQFLKKANVINVLMLGYIKYLEKKWTKRSKQLHIKHASVRDESAEGRGRAGFRYPVANLQEGRAHVRKAQENNG